MLFRFVTMGCCLLLLGCSGFAEVDSGPAPGDGSRDAPAASETSVRLDLFASGGTGPGPYGALPSGYCCQSDLDCRYRSCVDINGSKMCSDPCQSDDGCAGRISGLTCNQTSGRCEPDSPTATCVDAATFPYGAKGLGACCIATHDGWAGFECQGNHCGAFGDLSNPYICTQVCYKPADCPGAFNCLSTGYGYGLCAPEAPTYSCTK